MKLSQPLLSLALLAAGATAVPGGYENNHHSTPPSPHHPLPLVDSQSLRAAIKSSALLAKAKKLEAIAYATPTRNRVIGSPGHNATINFIKDIIASYSHYYTYYLQPFDLYLGVSANLTVNDAALEVYAVGLSPSGAVKAPVVVATNLGCEASDYPASAAGSIVLIKRGTCVSAIKSALAGSAGAVGALIYNNGPGNLDGYSLQRNTTAEGSYVPTGGISEADGEAIIAQLAAGTEVVADLSTELALKRTFNVIAQTIGGDQHNVIHIGGHSDSVAQGPGMNDNGSGTISILETAIALTKFSVKNAVRFSWWSAEESGLLGAEYYVSKLPQTEVDKIRLFLDFDMMASPNYAYQIYDGDGSTFNESGPPGSAEAEKEFQYYFSKVAKLNYTAIEFDGRSDYGPFLEAGIPAGGIAAGAEGIKTEEEAAMFGGEAGVAYDVNYHAAGDDLSNMNMVCWMEMTKAIAHMTATYAKSFKSLPKRSEEMRVKRMETGKKMYERATGAPGRV